MRFSYAVVALIGAAHAMPTVGSLVSGRSVCNGAASECKGVARAVVADQAALDARKKSRQAKSDAVNATTAEARSVKDSKRSKNLFSKAESRAANETDVEARALGDTVGLKTRDGKKVRTAAAVTDDAALGAREKSQAAKSAAGNATAEARRSVGDSDRKNEGRRAVTDDAAMDARTKTRQAKSAAANGTAAAGGEGDADAEARKARKARKSRRSHQLW